LPKKWSVELVGEPGVICVDVRGRVDLTLAKNILGEMWAAQAETGVHRVLWDLRAASVPESSAAQLRGLTHLPSRERPGEPVSPPCTCWLLAPFSPQQFPEYWVAELQGGCRFS